LHFRSAGDHASPRHIDKADRLRAMDQANLHELLAITKNDEQRAKIVRFGAFGSHVQRDGIANVPDPYGLAEEAFVSMYNQIEDAAQGLVKAIQDDSLENI